MTSAFFHSFSTTGGWHGRFIRPVALRQADRLADVLPIIEWAEQTARQGRWVALLLSYEAAPAFDPALTTHEPGPFPLAWAACFDSPDPLPEIPGHAPVQIGAWQPQIGRDEYESGIRRIKDYIACGDTYQVNYTFPLRCSFQGDGLSWFFEKGPAQAASWSAFVDLGRFQVLSFSPELFFEWRDGRVQCRPMKGTGVRGRWFADDEARITELSNSRKDRAENLMITDMVRNDLGRIARPGSVKTRSLFEIERYPTLFQMTSTIEAVPREALSLAEVFRALFPGASITGAPKVRTMEIIRELEPHPRGLYTGAIGLIQPGGAAVFNMPIRTVVRDRERAEASLHVGGGVTWDSTATGEYEECRLKAVFLSEPSEPFSLLETLRLENGRLYLLERHLERLRQSARYFGYPLDEGRVRESLNALAAEKATETWRTRLWINSAGDVTVEAELLAPDSTPWAVALATEPVNSQDRFLYHKTTRRRVYEQAMAQHPGCRDVVIWNERGELTESCLANLVVVLDGQACTPPLSCGLLPGVLRAEWLAGGRLTERVLFKEDLARAQEFYLINSVRGRIHVRLGHGGSSRPALPL